MLLSCCIQDSLSFDNLIKCWSLCVTLGLFYLEFFDFLGCADSYLLSNLESFNHYLFKCPFCPFFSETPIMHMLVFLLMSHRSLSLCSPFLILFSFCCLDWLISVDLLLSLMILLHTQICSWNLIMNVLFQLMYFSPL